MKERGGRKGTSTVEASILFPLIILLTVGGFSLMVRWYRGWEMTMERHAEERKDDDYSENVTILRWEQWGELLEDDDDGERSQ